MDVDNGPADGSGGGIDIEQSLLQQFSCMGTTDRDELIQQLQKVLGSHLNYSTAAFFLDMNNWNLQGAICSYFDVENSQKLPSMALASDPNACESESIEPNVPFQKTWNICNSGNEAWPAGCYLQCADGDRMGASRKMVPCLYPGQSTFVTVDMVSPSVAGVYQSKWRLCTPAGTYFGDPVWAIVTVVEEGTMALTEQLQHLHDLGSQPANTVQANPFTPHRLSTDNAPPDNTDTNMC